MNAVILFTINVYSCTNDGETSSAAAVSGNESGLLVAEEAGDCTITVVVTNALGDAMMLFGFFFSIKATNSFVLRLFNDSKNWPLIMRCNSFTKCSLCLIAIVDIMIPITTKTAKTKVAVLGAPPKYAAIKLDRSRQKSNSCDIKIGY